MPDVQAGEAGESVIEAAVDQIAFNVRNGLTPEEAARRVAGLVGQETARTALRLHRERADRVRTMREPGAVIRSDGLVEPWYLGPSDDDVFWPAYRDYLLNVRNRSRDEVNDVDRESTKILSLLPHSGTGRIATRGLVMGSVQSGKTGNFTAVITKAADVGYKFFIVLSGLTNLLRSQTQGRLDADALQHNSDRWITLTNPDEDFTLPRSVNVNSFLTGNAAHRTICVVKKNAFRLRRLQRWLTGARPEILRACPILIIDDEADQASLNAHRDPARRTEINRLVVEILGALPKAAYIGYTATPYANFLTDPAEGDVYPRDFIVDLDPPEAYFGPERIFGREQFDWDEPELEADGLDMIRLIDDAELPQLHPASRADRGDFVPQATESLKSALRYFVMATAARHYRGQSGEHSTMLVHTSQYTSVHQSFVQPVNHLLNALAGSLRAGDAATVDALRALWEAEQEKVPSDGFSLAPVPFDAILPLISGVLDAIEVKVENAQSGARIDYEVPGRTYVVIGGNVLARGLTLEGLVVSFFIRSASAYDALLQMGRWFGFRRGYEDLPRVWMTKELKDAFYHLATVEEEIRHQIGFYEHQHINPLTLGVRIRTHPHLAITSRLKMRSAVKAEMSFSNKSPQTILFHHRNRDWLEANLEAARSLIGRSRSMGIEPTDGRDPKYQVFRGVPAAEVLQFLEEYSFHPDQIELQGPLVRGYIQDQNNRGNLEEWNVVVVSRSNSSLGDIDLGLPARTPLVKRSRFERGENPLTADIRALISQGDIVADLDVDPAEIKRLNSWEKLKNLREQSGSGAEGRGMLLLYPISRNSDDPRSPKRHPLNAVEDVLGVGLVFPDAKEDTPQEYMTADLPDLEIEEVDFGDEDEDQG
jgi:hypothetical protein